MSISFSLSTLTFAYVPPATKPPAVEPAPAAPTSPVLAVGAAAPGAGAIEGQSPLASAVTVAARSVAGTEPSVGSGDDLEQALKSFTHALAHTLRAALREGQDDGDGPGRSHGHGHAYGHDMQAFHHRHSHARYGDMAPATDRLQALATRLQGAAAEPVPVDTAAPVSVEPAAPVAPGAQAIPPAVEGDGSAPSTAAPVPASATPTITRTGDSEALGRLDQRLLAAFSQLQSALGLTPSENPLEQRSALAAMLRDVADRLSVQSGGAQIAPEPAATGTLLQVTA